MTAENNKKNERRAGIKSLPDEERPREKLFKYGAGKLSNPELVAIILGSGTGNESALLLAEKLISMDSAGIAYFTNCQPEEYCRIRGIGTARAAQLSAAVELGKRIFSIVPERIRVDCSEDIAGYMMKDMCFMTREVFRVVMLNVKNEIIGIEDIAVGGLSSAQVHPREVFANSIKKSANSVILIHNHPSGNPAPSRSDIRLTERLTEAGRILGIQVLDHIVIGNGSFVSIVAENRN